MLFCTKLYHHLQGTNVTALAYEVYRVYKSLLNLYSLLFYVQFLWLASDP